VRARSKELGMIVTTSVTQQTMTEYSRPVDGD
jgi:hypothetical protein